MKFCLVTTFLPPYHFGGDGVFVANLANLLVANGHRVQIVHCRVSFDALGGRASTSDRFLDPRVLVHSLESKWGPLSPMLTQISGYPCTKHGTLERILSQDFDVVHWHNVSLVAGAGGLRLGKGVRLCTAHDYWWICPTHILFKYDGAVCRERECLKCVLAHHRPPQPWRAGGWLGKQLRNLDRFLVPSEFAASVYRNSGLGMPVTVLRHFVAPTPQDPAGGFDSEPGYYLVVGRMEEFKGIQTILPLFKKPGRRLKIAGTGSFESNLMRQAAGNPQVEFLGKIDQRNLSSLYANARATLVPSICWETFGLTIIESLQHQTPAIVSDYGALPEQIRHTGGGWVYRDLDELSVLLDCLDEQPGIARDRGVAGCSALAQFSPETYLRRYLEIIDEERRHQAASTGRPVVENPIGEQVGFPGE